MTPTYYYTAKGSDKKVPARSQELAESYAAMGGGEVFVQKLTEPILFSSEESMSKSQAITLPKTLGDWLTFLIAFGPALSASYADIMAIVEIAKRIAGRFGTAPEPSEGGLSLTNLTEEEAAQLEEVRCLMVANGQEALFDGSGILSVWAWLKAHPEVLSFLVSLFAKAKG